MNPVQESSYTPNVTYEEMQKEKTNLEFIQELIDFQKDFFEQTKEEMILK